MTRYHYPKGALLGDYARAALGLALTLPPLLLTGMLPAIAAIFASLALLFGAFALSTMVRQLGTLALDETGIAVEGALSRRIDWRALERMTLRWFASRRDRGAGFMQLVLKGGGRRIALDSRIEGFAAIAAAASRAAESRGLGLSDSTLANLAALGIAREALPRVAPGVPD